MKFFFLAAALFCFQLTYSQDLPNFESITLEKGPDYKAAESSVLAAANYVLSTPVDDNNDSRKKALSFVLRWMMGTPDYSFQIDAEDSKIFKGSDAMLGVYMTALSKYAIENPTNAKDQKLVKDGARDMVIAYCQKAENNLKMTKGLKKVAEQSETR